MTDEVQQLIDRGEEALGELFLKYRPRLEQMVDFRLDARLRGRIDPSDVAQEAYMRMATRLDNFIEENAVSVFVWMRSQTYQALIEIQRKHSWKKRNPRQEVHRQKGPSGDSSVPIAEAMVGLLTSPSRAAVKAEEIDHLRKALEGMDETDREVLAMRHFEHLSNNEVAEALKLTVTAASNRYVRAMTRLGEIMNPLDEQRTSLPDMDGPDD
jgi:RNA polymerase sigma-70 factor (ECF subfamily)